MANRRTTIGGAGAKLSAVQIRKLEEEEKKAKDRVQAQADLRAQVIADQQMHDPIVEYVEDLVEEKEDVNALNYKIVKYEKTEWHNIPKLTAKYCIKLEQQVDAISLYLFTRSAEETTKHLRVWAEQEIERSDSQFSQFKKETVNSLDQATKMRLIQSQFLERVDADQSTFKNYLDNMKKDSVFDIFKHIIDGKNEILSDNLQDYETEEYQHKNYLLLKRIAEHDVLKFDLAPENLDKFNHEKSGLDDIIRTTTKKSDVSPRQVDGEVDELVDKKEDEGEEKKKKKKSKDKGASDAWKKPKIATKLPNNKENPLTKARTHSFKQLYDFTNLILNKSFLRKRVYALEQDVSVAQSQLQDLFAWRKDLETRMSENFKNVNDTFAKNNERHTKHVHAWTEKNKELGDRITNADANITNIFATLEENRQERDDLQETTEKLSAQIDKNEAKAANDLTLTRTQLLEKQNYFEKETNQSFKLLSNELEKLKYDLSDTIDSRFEHISKSIEQQTKALQESYEKLSSGLQTTSSDITLNYKEQMVNIKAMVATYFAKIDSQISDNNKKTAYIQKEFDKFQANFVNPASEIDGKVHSMNMKIQASEQMREAQFTVLKGTIQKTIAALETQNLSYAQNQSLQSLILAQSPGKNLSDAHIPGTVNLSKDNSRSGNPFASQAFNMVPSVQHLQNEIQQIHSQTQLEHDLHTAEKHEDLHLPSIDDSIGDLSGIKLIQNMTSNKNSQQKGVAIRFGNPMKGNQLGKALPSTQTFQSQGSIFDELNPSALGVLQESQVFQRRLRQIAQRLEEEVEPFKPISKDNLRVNRNGVSKDLLNAKSGNPFNKKRQSVDGAQLGAKNKNMKSDKSLRARNNSVLQSPDKLQPLNQTMMIVQSPHSSNVLEQGNSSQYVMKDKHFTLNPQKTGMSPKLHPTLNSQESLQFGNAQATSPTDRGGWNAQTDQKDLRNQKWGAGEQQTPSKLSMLSPEIRVKHGKTSFAKGNQPNTTKSVKVNISHFNKQKVVNGYHQLKAQPQTEFAKIQQKNEQLRQLQLLGRNSPGQMNETAGYHNPMLSTQGGMTNQDMLSVAHQTQSIHLGTKRDNRDNSGEQQQEVSIEIQGGQGFLGDERNEIKEVPTLENHEPTSGFATMTTGKTPQGQVLQLKKSNFPNVNMVDPMQSVDASLQIKKKEMEMKLQLAKDNRKNQ